MKILVLGGTGFFGRYLVAELRRRGHTIVLGTREHQVHARSDSFYCDIEKEKYDPIERFPRFDALIFLAWTNLFRENRNSRIHVEFREKSEKFFESIVNWMPRRVVVSGSCEEYGLNEGNCKDDDQVIPTTLYGIQKNELRLHLGKICASAGSDLLWLRFFYLYGNGLRGDSLFSALNAANARNDMNFTLETSGLQRLDYLNVEDAAKITSELIERSKGNGIYNVGSGVAKTLREHLEGWKIENDWKINIRYASEERSINRPMAQYADLERVRKILG